MELPFVDVYVEDCPSLVLWQHSGYQASRADTAHSSPHGGASEGGKSASRGLGTSGLGWVMQVNIKTLPVKIIQPNKGKRDGKGTVPREM